MNKQLQLTVREWMLLVLLALIGTGVVFYYWLWSSQLALNSAARTELLLAEQQLSERLAWQAQDGMTQKRLQALATEQELLQAQLDVLSHEQHLIDYLVVLSEQTNCGVRSLEIAPDMLQLSVSATTFEEIYAFLQAIESCPNLGPVAATLGGNASNFSLQLTFELIWGQLSPHEAKDYPRTSPFGG